MSARPLVMAGPSGVGKGTLIARLMKDFPGSFGFCVSHTTRSPRPGEEDGIAYHFTELGAMKKMVEEGHFLEYADVHGNLYGTSRAAVEKVAQAGSICILDIDVQGVRLVKAAQLDPAPLFVFVRPPSMEALEARLRGRGTETEARVQRRLANAAAEIGYASERGGANFDAVLVNDDLELCYAQLKALLDCGDDEGGVPGLRSPKTPSPSASPNSPTKSMTQPPARASASSTEAI